LNYKNKHRLKHLESFLTQISLFIFILKICKTKEELHLLFNTLSASFNEIRPGKWLRT
jgi:hypothetical protein